MHEALGLIPVPAEMECNGGSALREVVEEPRFKCSKPATDTAVVLCI